MLPVDTATHRMEQTDRWTDKLHHCFMFSLL